MLGRGYLEAAGVMERARLWKEGRREVLSQGGRHHRPVPE